MRRSIAAGNWKMNGLRENFNDILLIDAASENVNCDVILCVPDTLIREMSEKTKNIFSGGQNCHIESIRCFYWRYFSGNDQRCWRFSCHCRAL
jgi:triosephosphate isomerase